MASWTQLLEASEELGPDPALTDLDDGALVAALSSQAVTVTRETARWIVLVAEAVVRGVWADQGATSPGQWLSWKVGLAPSTARDHVRIGLALRRLPRIRSAFLGGQVSYSKVRAMTRLGHQETEELLLEWADAAPAAELERIITHTRRSCRIDGINPDPLVADPIDHTDPDARPERYDLRQRQHGTTELTFTLDEADAARIDTRLRWLAHHHDDPDLPFPAKITTILDHAIRAATLAAPADQSGDDRDRLVIAVQATALATAPTTDPTSAPTSAPTPDPAGPDDSAESPRLRLVPRRRAGAGPSMSVRTLRRLACEAAVVLLLEDDDRRPLDVGRTQRRATVKQRRALRLRDPSCRFPGCTADRHLHVHHALEWDADDGPTDMDNLLHLCSFHHRFLHNHDWTARPDGRGRFTFLDPNDQPFTACPDPIGAAGGDTGDSGDSAEAHPAHQTAQGNPRSLQPRHWQGDHVDLGMCVAVLRQELDRRNWRQPDDLAA